MIALAAEAAGGEDRRREGGGFPIGNFGICGQITGGGAFLSRIMVNPSREGPWLEELPGGRLLIECGGQARATEEFASVRAERAFPFASLEVSDPGTPGVRARIRSFSPVARQDAFRTSLPVILAEITLTSERDEAMDVSAVFEMGAGHALMEGTERVAVLFADADESEPGAPENGWRASARVRVPAHGSRTVRFVLAYYDPDGYYAEELAGVGQLAQCALATWQELAAATEEFSSLLPSVGDAKLDEYLRWYLPAAVYLTRITKQIVITMGYCELNQRDSFWTSWAHVVFWPDLERRMLEETAGHVRPDGKVPTTILPIIEREDDLDINCYFIVRLKRYHDFTHDDELVRNIWPDAKPAVEWLAARDTDGDGMLEQGSYWADWKDVPGVEGRRHAPHFEFAWLAALRAARDMAAVAGDMESSLRYEALAARAAAMIGAGTDDGGLWNGDFYTTRWQDGQVDGHIQQDQLIGAVFGLIPPDRLERVYAALNRAMAPWGIRETWPYREPFNNTPGDYHNGGVWPFLSFMDALGRFRGGYPQDAEELMRRVGRWDLEEFGDYTPHEYLLGETGENCGPVIQGWNADYFAALLHGALGVEVLGRESVQIAPRIPEDRDFRTPIVLPWGVLWLEASRGTITLASECRQAIAIRYGKWSGSDPGKGAERVGEGWLTWSEAVLEPGATWWP